VTLEQLRIDVLNANLRAVHDGLVIETFGNASGIDRERGLVAIKPSGVDYAKLTPADLVISDLEGRIVEGTLRPSSDLDTHLALYKAFPLVGGIVHTHSHYATAWAQARREIPCFGTTHADYFHGSVPVTDEMQPHEIADRYELNTGHVIARRFAGMDPMSMCAVLVAGHAPFAWGRTPADAAHNAFVLEEIARLAFTTIAINAASVPISETLKNKHFFRKHGPGAYYGQK